MKAIAVFPGKSGTVHLADLNKPSVNDVPNTRGVLVRNWLAVSKGVSSMLPRKKSEYVLESARALPWPFRRH